MQDIELRFYGQFQCFEDPQDLIETDDGPVRGIKPYIEFEDPFGDE